MNSDLILRTVSFRPLSLESPYSWVGHLPFAYWLIQGFKPKIFVELGTHSANSYFSFCQSVLDAHLNTKCYAVDTWAGDEHAGSYDNSIYQKVNEQNKLHYSQFSQLLRTTFDGALSYFEDQSIDLLHIDGLHTYEAVCHDFYSWLPKLAPGAIVIFHDTNVRERGFGVWRLWGELQKLYPKNIEFTHSHGLGVLQIPGGQSGDDLPIFDGSLGDEFVKSFFANLGSSINNLSELNELKGKNYELQNNLLSLTNDHQNLIKNKDLVEHYLNTRIYDLEIERESLLNSRSWKISAPLRMVSGYFSSYFSKLKKLSALIKSSGGFFEFGTKAARYIATNGARSLVFDSLRVKALLAPEDLMRGIIKDPLVSIIAVNYNGENDLIPFLESIVAQSYPNIEIILVDNCSSDKSREIISTFDFGSIAVNFLWLDENVGFAEGCNIGRESSSGEFYALINVDTRVDSNWLLYLVQGMQNDASAAAITSKTLFWSEFCDVEFHSTSPVYLDIHGMLSSLEYKKYFLRRGSIDKGFICATKGESIRISLPVQKGLINLNFKSVGLVEFDIVMHDEDMGCSSTHSSKEGRVNIQFDLYEFSKGRARNIINNAGSSIFNNLPGDRGFGEYDIGQYEIIEYVDLFCGCSVLIRAESIIGRKIFVPEFFAYYEDSELSLWLAARGHKIVYEPMSIVFHRHSAVSTEGSVVWECLVGRSFAIFKNYSAPKKLKKLLDAVAEKYYERIPNQLAKTLRDLDLSVITRLNGEGFTPVRDIAGVYNHYWNTYGGGESHALSFASELQKLYPVYLISEEDFDLEKMKSYFPVDISRCQKLIVGQVTENFTENFKVFVNSTFGSNIESRAKNSWFVVSFPHRYINKKIINCYKFLFNSAYTESWAKKYWGKRVEGQIHYPIRAVSALQRSSLKALPLDLKTKTILSVGRFFKFGHSKNQREIVAAFKQIVRANPSLKDWKLVLVGSLNLKNIDDMAYFEEVRAMSIGANIELLPNAPKDALESCYAKSMLYVHASGLGRNPERNPENFEHFGITPLEAMTFGCYPIVHSVGGPAELVRLTGVGETFSSQRELTHVLAAALYKSHEELLALCEASSVASLDFVRRQLSKSLPEII